MNTQNLLKQKPLRNPGQGLDEKIDQLVNDKFLAYVLFAAAFWIVAILEWIAKTLKYPRLPGTYALAAMCFSAVAAYQFFRLRREIRNLKLGRDGEREVAEVLDVLKQEPWRRCICANTRGTRNG